MFKNRLYKNLQVYENFCEFYNILKHILKEIQYSCSGKRYGTWTSCCNSFNLQFPVKEVLYDSSDYINDLYTQYVSIIKYSTFFILYNYRTIITFIVFFKQSIDQYSKAMRFYTNYDKVLFAKKFIATLTNWRFKKGCNFQTKNDKGIAFFCSSLTFSSNIIVIKILVPSLFII